MKPIGDGDYLAVWNQEQKDALDQIAAWIGGKGEQIISLTGPAGTGKTTLLAAIRGLFGKPVMWTAMTGKAALRMSEAAGVPATTLHAALYAPPKVWGGHLSFTTVVMPKGEYLVVDESSMMSPKIFEDLQIWVNQGVRMLFVGDGYQLPPVLTAKEIEQYGKDFSVFRLVKGPVLTTIMRSDDQIIQVATMLREKDRVPRRDAGEAYQFRRADFPGLEAVESYLADRDGHVLITWTNRLRMTANQEIRNRLGYNSVTPQGGEPVMICRNGQDALNGEVYEVESLKKGPPLGEVKTHWLKTRDGKELLVNLTGREFPVDGFFPELKDWKAYRKKWRGTGLPEPLPVTYGYVSTAHKAQGSEHRRVTVFLDSGDLQNPHFREDTTLPNGSKMSFATRWLYTSLSRAKQRVTLLLGTC